MKRTILYGLAIAAMGAAPVHAQSQQEQIDLTKAKIEQYVELRQKIAKESNEWRAYQEMTERRIKLYEAEKAKLQEQIASAQAETTSAEVKIASVKAEIEALRNATRVVDAALPDLELRIRELSQYFPRPLSDKVRSLLPQIGKSRRAADRMVVLIGVMNEVDKFNSDFTSDVDERVLPNGDRINVDVVYLGMAVAYAADESGENGWIGKPAAGGWIWTEAPAEAGDIRRAIDYYQGKNKPAVLVGLPAEVVDITAQN